MPVSRKRNSDFISEGDRVRVKSLEWYKSMPKSARGDIESYSLDHRCNFSSQMTRYCGMEFIVKEVIVWKGHKDGYKLMDPTGEANELDMKIYTFTESMLERCQ